MSGRPFTRLPDLCPDWQGRHTDWIRCPLCDGWCVLVSREHGCCAGCVRAARDGAA